MKSLNADQVAWLDALLSGKYRRTNSRLGRKQGGMSHCCLGVFCDLQPGVKWEDAYELPSTNRLPMVGEVDLSSGGGLWLSEEMRLKLDLTDEEQREIGGRNDIYDPRVDPTFNSVVPEILRILARKGYDVSAYEGRVR